MKFSVILLSSLLFSFITSSQSDCIKTEFICDFENAILEAECVKVLYLENEILIEDTMLQFINLKKVILVNCNSEDFIQYAYKFSNLESLTIQYNINSIPKSIGNCNNLQELIIFNSEIEKIPNTIENLVSLKTLKLNYSLIKDVPKELFTLKGLKFLSLNWGENLSFLSDKVQKNIISNLPNCKCIF